MVVEELSVLKPAIGVSGVDNSGTLLVAEGMLLGLRDVGSRAVVVDVDPVAAVFS